MTSPHYLAKLIVAVFGQIFVWTEIKERSSTRLLISGWEHCVLASKQFFEQYID